MNLNGEQCLKLFFALAMNAVLLGALGCNFGPSKKSEEKTAAAPAANPGGPAFNGGLYCLEKMSQASPGPAQPIHFSYKVNGSDGTTKDFEADLAGDTLDVTLNKKWPATDFDREMNQTKGVTPTPIHDGIAESTNTNHFTRGDLHSWTAGWGMTTQGGTPWSVFIFKPPVTLVGPENVGGYDTIKYAVDTSHQGQMDKFAGTAGMGVQDYNITGTAWVTKDTGCILQYNIDMEDHAKDGKVSKTHFEGAVAKK